MKSQYENIMSLQSAIVNYMRNPYELDFTTGNVQRKESRIMNKQELVVKIMEKTGANKPVTERFLNALIETVTEALTNGDKIQLIGFGTFETRERNARTARNPKTGETVRISAKTSPAFKAGKALKEAVNK